MSTMRCKLFITLAAVLLPLLLSACGDDAPPPTPKLKRERYIPPPPKLVKTPPMPFSDVTATSGIVFRHETGAFKTEQGDSRYLPECMGSGVILFDPDGDGDDDVFLINSTWFAGHEGPGPAPTSHLFRNDGQLRFVDITQKSGLGVTCYGMGGAAADYDGDSDQDLLLTSWGGLHLLRNDGQGHFEDVTQSAGLTMPGWTDSEGRKGPSWSTGATFFDADRDGDLDLFVANYVRWSPQADIFFAFDGRTKSFTIPDRYDGDSCRFFRNEGDGTFTDVTAESGVLNNHAKALGVITWDFNGDGLLDVVVSNDQAPTLYYRNKGHCQFEESGLEAGIAYAESGKVRAGMGMDVADCANDGVPYVPIGNFSREPVALWRQVGPNFFRDVAQQSGLSSVTRMELTFGLIFADLDLDGWQDLVLANGHLEPRIQEVWSDIPYAQVPLLLHNQKEGRFAKWNATAGRPFQTPLVGRGLACADLDQDGDLDLVITTSGGSARLLRNDLDPERRPLRVRLEGKGANRDAIGARIEIQCGTLRQTRQVKTGGSYLSQSELIQTFGLGSANTIDKLTITWPDGSKKQLTQVDPRSQSVLVIRQE